MDNGPMSEAVTYLALRQASSDSNNSSRIQAVYIYRHNGILSVRVGFVYIYRHNGILSVVCLHLQA